MMLEFIIGVAVGLGIGFGLWYPDPKEFYARKYGAIDALDLTRGLSSIEYVTPEVLEKFHDEMEKEAAVEYAVTGTPRHIPWSRRKKELEAAARQKRRQLESFREEA